MRQRFSEQIARHALHREIVATQVGNQMVNLSGISFDHRMSEDHGVGVYRGMKRLTLGGHAIRLVVRR